MTIDKPQQDASLQQKLEYSIHDQQRPASTLEFKPYETTDTASTTSKKMTSRTRMFIERITCDATLQKNDNRRRLYKSSNPILEELLEAEERVIEHEKICDEKRQVGMKKIKS